jgi:hypothetical protein
MVLSWNEIKSRALDFSKEWKDTSNEDADAKSFLEALFNVFEVPIRIFAAFEYKVQVTEDKTGYIDLLRKLDVLVLFNQQLP